jgi:hypothetical protein
MVAGLSAPIDSYGLPLPLSVVRVGQAVPPQDLSNRVCGERAPCRLDVPHLFQHPLKEVKSPSGDGRVGLKGSNG